MEIDGKVALVTGGASGIGLATVKELLKHGAKVALCDVNEVQGQKEVKVLQVEYDPQNVIFMKCDITKTEEFEECFQKAISEFGCLDIVFNNAGILDEISWEKMYDVNIKGTTNGVLLGLKYLGKDSLGTGGVIVNTASVAAFMPFPLIPLYTVTKHAVIGLTRSFGTESYFDRTRVRVVALCPAQTATNIIKVRNMARIISKMSIRSMLKFRGFGQSPALVADAVLKMIREAENGSAFVCHDGIVTEFQFPHFMLKDLDPSILS